MIDLKQAIESADVNLIHAFVTAKPELARALISFGPNLQHQVPPLHYVCDVLFRKLVSQERALVMARVLIHAGLDIDEAYAKSGDTYLITAASLGAELVGVRLVDLGANVHAQGLFGATALHWSAMMGLPKLAAALLNAGARTDLPDVKYKSTPLEWAQHAWTNGTNGNRDSIPEVASLLGGAVG